MIDHGPLRRRAPSGREEQTLGREVIFHGAVKIQVIPREIGEYRGMERDSVHSAQSQGVRGDFHGDMRAARAVPARAKMR